MKKTRYERRMAWRKNRQREIVEHLLMIVLGVIFFIAVACFMATESAEATPEDVWAAEQEAAPIVRGKPTDLEMTDATVSEHETDPASRHYYSREVDMYIKTHLCIDKDDLIGFLEGTIEVVSVKQIEYLGADGRTYTYEVRYK